LQILLVSLHLLPKNSRKLIYFATFLDYDKINPGDRISLRGLSGFAPGKQLDAVIKHSAGGETKIKLNHSFNDLQIKWFKAGSALNYMKEKKA
jgi:aconitate hydratase